MSNEHFDLSGRRALVTGASRGIGRAIAFGLASAGADVALAARDKERLTEIAVEIRGLGQNACVVPLDVSKLDTVGPAIDAAAAGLGGLDVLVNNAGVNGPGGFDVMEACDLPSGTVYPALRRLERAGLLESVWEADEDARAQGRPRRKTYHLTKLGENSLVLAERKLEEVRRLLGVLPPAPPAEAG